jgi:hypothetical protein
VFVQENQMVGGVIFDPGPDNKANGNLSTSTLRTNEKGIQQSHRRAYYRKLAM